MGSVIHYEHGDTTSDMVGGDRNGTGVEYFDLFLK